ncbi:MAG TPA: methyltransferase domain-containing protein [Aggregatilineales bacterium]|nr:methyltransferase domain-containing protein [Aggregatilineales bacterium]
MPLTLNQQNAYRASDAASRPRWQPATATGLPLPAARFDLAISSWVLEYLPNPESCCREVARILTPGAPALLPCRRCRSAFCRL